MCVECGKLVNCEKEVHIMRVDCCSNCKHVSFEDSMDGGWLVRCKKHPPSIVPQWKLSFNTVCNSHEKYGTN